MRELRSIMGKHSYDLSSRVEAINGILSAVPVGGKIVGHHLIWHSDDITTAVYAFWSEIYTYDGSVLKTYDLTENEYISGLAFSDDHTKLNVTIRGEDDIEKTDIIEL